MTRLLPLVVTVTALLVLFACAKRKDWNDLAQHESELKVSFMNTRHKMGRKRIGWSRCAGGSADGVYTFQLQESLLRDKRPLAIRAILHDVGRKEATLSTFHIGAMRPSFSNSELPRNRFRRY